MAEFWPKKNTVSYISKSPSKNWQSTNPKQLVILGSTGSIGCSALNIIEKYPNNFNILALSCATRVEILAKQATIFKPKILVVLDKSSREKLKTLLPKSYSPEILIGKNGYEQIVKLAEADTIISAQVGAAGLHGTISAILHGKTVCLANKESLVLAGSIIRSICKITNACILPIDSEHNAIFQCLAGQNSPIKNIILTASGGPFFGKSTKELQNISPQEALKHPNWNMGAKITIDSATMMNKGLEVIEAYHLFGIDLNNIKVVIHPQSLIHSMVELQDNSIIAQISNANMQLPIAQCLFWPNSAKDPIQQLDLFQIPSLSFHEPDTKTFPCLELARQSLGNNNSCIILNAANEIAVELFLQNKCKFTDIPKIISKTLQEYKPQNIIQINKIDPLALNKEMPIILKTINDIDMKSRKLAKEIAKSGEYK